jgi:hypothetical protein
VNAVKHGFYASKLPQSDRAALATSEFSGLTEEISLLRTFIRRVISLTPPPDDFYANLDSLRVICHATTALSRLVRTHALLGTASSEFERARDQALREIAEELFLNNPGVDHPPGADSPPGLVDDFPAQAGFSASPSKGETEPSFEPYQPP